MPNDSVFGTQETPRKTRPQAHDDDDFSEDELLERDQEDGPRRPRPSNN